MKKQELVLFSWTALFQALVNKLSHYWEGGGGRWLLGLIFAGYVPLASQSPYAIIVYSVANYRPHLSHFKTNM